MTLGDGSEMQRIAVEVRRSRGRLAYDPLDPERILWCRHIRGTNPRHMEDAGRKPIGQRMFALADGDCVRLRYVDDGEYRIMLGEHPRSHDELLKQAECIVCGAHVDLRCDVEAVREAQ